MKELISKIQKNVKFFKWWPEGRRLYLFDYFDHKNFAAFGIGVGFALSIRYYRRDYEQFDFYRLDFLCFTATWMN